MEETPRIRIKSLIENEMKKDVIEAVLSPTKISRPTEFAKKPEYEHLIENSREIYLSSAFWKSHWMWGHIKEALTGMYKRGNAILFVTDYELTVRHGIRTKDQMRSEKAKFDATTFEMEYMNLMVGGSENQMYTYNLVSNAQVIKKAWYPKTKDDLMANKRKRVGDIEKTEGEIRIISMDIAVAESTKKTRNDASAVKCIRAIPDKEKYERQEVYSETFKGQDLEKQAIRARQLLEDFQADYIVIDGRTFGINMADIFSKVMYDEERDKEYTPIKAMNNEALADRCKNPNASPIMWVFTGSADTNHIMHTTMLSSLMDGKYKMLVNATNAKEHLNKKAEYVNADGEGKALFELPYVQSDLTLNEMVNLNKEFIQGGKIKLTEPNTGTKDRYIASAMGNLFIQELETGLTKKKKSNGWGTAPIFVNSIKF